ncbi:SDR family NAD(P)-dependent oxidoreductase [Streptomyces sp. NBC_00582]|uniref:SDR family NAD(P)-dependent oxidoreductase n=1 Tax=Streptomyces sp. NBC_00582 TaxID=2975783 RepID=UPI002E81C1FE|nr:SDR family oxidoreductase [Streptomyces sp. NBC_00582]WUB63785.1 SDR family oxidoreductase [Streptomyces sp. NBC_00582]
MSQVDYRGQTTLITGAGSGIGAEFARQLAARGSDLVLVGRRRERLEALAGELVPTYGVEAVALPFDLAQPLAGEALAAEVERRGLAVTSLVNNAGFGTYGPFHREDSERLRAEIAVDVTAVVDLSRAFIERLRSAGRGVLVNVASMAAYQPDPHMAVYGATKAFVLSFTEALWYESRGTGLRVIALSPGATRTEFFDVVGTLDAAGGTRLSEPADVVRDALRALDRRNPPPSVISGRLNRAMTVAGRLVSRRRMVRTMGRMTTPPRTAG